MRPGRVPPAFLSLAALTVLAALSAAGEITARKLLRWTPPSAGDREFLRRFRDAWRPFFHIEEEDGRKFLVQSPRLNVFLPPQRFPLEKAPSVARVVVLGESSAASLGGELRVPREERFEVMNCAVGGASLEIVERKLRETTRYAPDMYVLLFGHNLYVPYATVSPWIHRVRALGRRSALVALLSRRLFRNPFEYIDPASRLAELEAFLARLGEEARRLEIPVVLCTAPSNLRFPPRFGDAERFHPDLLEAVYRHAAGDATAAIQTLDRSLREGPDALRHYQIGKWLLDRGNADDARRHLTAARDLDPDRNRATTAVNDLIRRAAGERGFWLLDLDAWARDRAPAGIPGWETIQDQQHLWDDLVRRAAWELLRLWREKGWPSPAPLAAAGPEPAADRSLDGFMNELRRRGGERREPYWFEAAADRFAHVLRHGDEKARRDLRERVLTAPEESRDDAGYRARLLLAYARAHWETGRRDDALSLLDGTRRSDPTWEEPDVQEGLWRISLGQNARADAAFRHALRKNPRRPDAAYYLKNLRAGPLRSSSGLESDIIPLASIQK